MGHAILTYKNGDVKIYNMDAGEQTGVLLASEDLPDFARDVMSAMSMHQLEEMESTLNDLMYEKQLEEEDEEQGE
jgi:hypothetical protein